MGASKLILSSIWRFQSQISLQNWKKWSCGNDSHFRMIDHFRMITPSFDEFFNSVSLTVSKRGFSIIYWRIWTYVNSQTSYFIKFNFCGLQLIHRGQKTSILTSYLQLLTNLAFNHFRCTIDLIINLFLNRQNQTSQIGKIKFIFRGVHVIVSRIHKSLINASWNLLVTWIVL